MASNRIESNDAPDMPVGNDVPFERIRRIT